MRAGKVIVVVDYQADFAEPKGNLYVKDGEKIQEPINNFLEKVKDKAYIIATKDWHPQNHISFKEWSQHCVQLTKGASLYFDTKNVNLIIHKGMKKDQEEYSAFENSNKQILKLLEFHDIYVCGLALDYCVLNTIKSIRAMVCCNVYCIKELTKSVYPNKEEEIIKKLKDMNVNIVNKQEAEDMICK